VKKGFIIAIDGPLASGKGTIAKKLASVLHGVDLYTGAMYRCLALFCINGGINLNDAKQVSSQLENVAVTYKEGKIALNGTDVTLAIQDSAVAQGASLVGVIPEVRKELVRRQQTIGNDEIKRGKIVIVEGRDIGTVVFPDAALRIYLTASETVRAKRRWTQNRHNGDSRKFEEMLEEVRIRDKRDSEREADPLARDPEKLGYFVLNNSEMNEQQTVDAIIAELNRRRILND
jgi:CMP/dCMP kinase